VQAVDLRLGQLDASLVIEQQMRPPLDLKYLYVEVKC
jgi:hypothetical protein